MITIERMMLIEKGDLQEAAGKLSRDDIPQIVEWLALKDDAIRYQAFLLLQNRSQSCNDVYPYWDTFSSKLKSDNSYQRSIGLMLIADNVKWDSEDRMEKSIDDCLELLNDEKPVTVRQCIQSMSKIVSCKPGLSAKIAGRLISFDIMSVKETMRKSILLDILNTLIVVRKEFKTNETESFIRSALSGDVLDKKSKKQIEALL
jgi:hypothetical protein